MTYRRVTIVGMNNPLSEDPAHALYPYPVNCTGWRVWQMLRARTGAWKSDYLRAFRRVNVGHELRWDPKRAAANWRMMERQILESSDTLVFLGAAVRRASGLLLPQLFVTSSVVCIPHPSGLNRWYNDERNRRVVELVLEELYLETEHGVLRDTEEAE